MAARQRRSFARSFAPDMNAPRAARRALQSLNGRIEESVLERGLLVVTELVTNSVRHAHLAPEQKVGLRVSAEQEFLRLEVTDEGTGFDPTSSRANRDLPEGGWGLWIVGRLTDRWGIDTSHSTRVWCELEPRSESEPGASASSVDARR